MTPSLQHEFSVELKQGNQDLAFEEAHNRIMIYLRENVEDSHMKKIPYLISLRKAWMSGSNLSADRNYVYNFVADFNIAG